MKRASSVVRLWNDGAPGAVESGGHPRPLSDPLPSIWRPGDALRLLPGELYPERRWVLASSSLMTGRRVTVLSSRIGRDFQRRTFWFDRLNHLLDGFVATDGVVLSCPGTTCHRFLKFGADERQLPLVECALPPTRQTFERWTSWLASSDGVAESQRRLAISPPARRPPERPSCSGARAERNGLLPPDLLPLADRLLATLGEEIYVLFVRSGGNLEQIVTHHLRHPPAWQQRWMLAADSESIVPALANQWMQLGMVAWTQSMDGPRGDARRAVPRSWGGDCDVRGRANEPSPVARGASDVVGKPRTQEATPLTSRLISLGDISPERYLAHWTRPQPGPWPDESESQYVCSLMHDPSARDRSALASLRRIVTMQRLIATNRLTRGETKVVCFTAQPLTCFGERRTFRSMHARWDFEPYGVCVERNWLIQQGARAVIYGDKATWQQLTEQDRPFFQHRGSSSGGQPFAWTAELEWRHAGDVDLRQLPRNDVLVFVPNVSLADKLFAICPWPITVLTPSYNDRETRMSQ